MKNLRKLFILVLLTIAFGVNAQSDTTIYFVNIYPGSAIYELEGHSGIIVDKGDGRPIAYNFGVFDFDAPNFVYRFVKGETDYMAVAYPADAFLYPYQRARRRIVAHELNLDGSQKRSLIEALNRHILPQNRTYRYNYVLDNCATRPLRMVEEALGDTILFATSPTGYRSSFRNVMRHYHAHYPWYQFGIDIALGSGIDRPLSGREVSFAPVELAGMLDSATVGGAPLAKGAQVWLDVPGDAAVEGPTPWPLRPITVCWAVFALAALLTFADLRRGRPSRWLDSLYFGIIGLTGCLSAFLIFISVHEATSPNYLFAWLNPFALFPAVAVWIKSAKKAVVWYQIINFAVLIALVGLWPLLPQSANPAFLPLVLAELLRSGLYITLSNRTLAPEKGNKR